jgi:hypothetical protein
MFSFIKMACEIRPERTGSGAPLQYAARSSLVISSEFSDLGKVQLFSNVYPLPLSRTFASTLLKCCGAVVAKCRVLACHSTPLVLAGVWWWTSTVDQSYGPRRRVLFFLRGFGFAVLEDRHGSVALRLSQDSVAVERQQRYLCLFRVVAYFSRFGGADDARSQPTFGALWYDTAPECACGAIVGRGRGVWPRVLAQVRLRR